MSNRLWRHVLAVCLVVTAGIAAWGDTPAWVKDVVCPMVGPFTKDSGPKGKTPADILQDFHPEIAEWSILPKLTTNPLCPKKILGGLEYQEFPQSPAHDFKLWEEQFGSKWDPNEDCGVAVPSSGKMASWKYGSEQTYNNWNVCHNSPKWHEFHKESIRRAARDTSCALIRQDNIGGPSGIGWDNGGWCKWCLNGFKQRLQRFTPEQLRAWGVPDLTAFDPGAYLRAQLAAKTPEQLIEDRIVREYIYFLQKSNLKAWRDEVEGAHKIRPEIPVCGNQGSGEIAAYPTVLLSDVGDLIFLENSRREYPDNANTINYAVALAGGRHAKPAWIWDFGRPEYMERVDQSLLFVAECYATGATPYYEMNNLSYSPVKGYYPIALSDDAYAALRGYAKFAEQHRDLLTRTYAADAQVALLYSVPSLVPKLCGALRLTWHNTAARQQMDPFVGFARALEANHIAYNVEILGDDEFWPDRDLAQRLSRYRVVICPAVEAMSDAQATVLREFVRNGGRLITSGDLATRDEQFVRRPQPALADLATAAGRGEVIHLTTEPADYLRSQSVQDARGASQTVILNQTAAKPLVVRGWSKCQDVAGAPGGEYSLWVDLTYTDGTPLWAQVAAFNTGNHDWQEAEYVIHPAKPVKSATVHALLRYRSGTVWFDDLFFGEQGSDRNLLKDPGFEDVQGGLAAAWDPFLGWQKTAAGYTPDSAVSHSGKTSIRCEISRPTGDSPVVKKLAAVFRAALAPSGPEIETDAPRTVFIRPVRKDRQVIVQLLNLNYDGGQDKVVPVGPIRLSIRLRAGEQIAGDVMLASPDQTGGDVALPHQVTNGRLTVAVPKLRIWSMVHFETK